MDNNSILVCSFCILVIISTFISYTLNHPSITHSTQNTPGLLPRSAIKMSFLELWLPQQCYLIQQGKYDNLKCNENKDTTSRTSFGNLTRQIHIFLLSYFVVQFTTLCSLFLNLTKPKNYLKFLYECCFYKIQSQPILIAPLGEPLF